MKKNVAVEALNYVQDRQIIGVGSGCTVNLFIEQLALNNLNVQIIPSSIFTMELLKKYSIPAASCEQATDLTMFVNEGDACNSLNQLIKSHSSSLVKEKMLANASKFFLCLVQNQTNPVLFNKASIPIEVLPIARSYVARCLVKLGGKPIYRNGFVTDNKNIIIDTYHLPMHQPIALEEELNNIPGVVANGIFASRAADLIIQ